MLVPSPVFTHSFPGRPATIPGGPEVGTHPAPRGQQVLPCLYLAQETGGVLCKQVGQAEGGEQSLAHFAESKQAKLVGEALHAVCPKYLVRVHRLQKILKELLTYACASALLPEDGHKAVTVDDGPPLPVKAEGEEAALSPRAGHHTLCVVSSTKALHSK